MKKKTLLVIAILVVGTVLAACSVSSSKAVSTQASQPQSGASQLTEPQKLAIGTLKLEGTDQAVDATQAATLLPLWKAAKTLGSSQTISTKEMDALYTQIKIAMTAEQIKAITAMDFSDMDLNALMAEYNVSVDTSAGSTKTASSSSGNTAGGPGPGGDGGGGAPPDGGGMAGGGSDMGASTGSGTQSRSSSSQTTTRAVSANVFIEPLIDLLKSKTAS